MNFDHCILFFRLKDSAKGAAKVGVTECTKEVQRYEDPDNANIEYWDLPGMGTHNFPAKTYFQDVKLNEYDTFVIFIDTRFREDDLELVRKITSHGKKYFFVRSKIDQDVTSTKTSDPESFNEAAVLAEVRSECSEKLGDLLSNEEKIFLISCHGFEKCREKCGEECGKKCGEKCGEKYLEKYQLEPLIKANRDALHQNQRDAMIRLLQTASKKALEEKVQALGGGKWKAALCSGAAASIPFLSAAVDVGLIVKEFKGYKHQLGIPEEGSGEFEKLDPKSKAKVHTFLKLLAEIATKGIAAVGILAAEATIEQVFSYIPLGLFIACPLSFGTTYCVLYYTLRMMADTAFAILEGTVQQLLDNN